MSNQMMQALEQLQQMQQRMEATQKMLESQSVSEEAGGGMVRATVDGLGRLMKLEIAPEAIDPAEKEILEDLVITAVNKALESAKKMAADEMEKATSGMMPNLPGLDLPF